MAGTLIGTASRKNGRPCPAPSIAADSKTFGSEPMKLEQEDRERQA